MFERKSDNWDTTIQEEYFTEAVAENLDTIDGWEDVDQIQVSTNSWRNEANRWRDEVETESSTKSSSTRKLKWMGVVVATSSSELWRSATDLLKFVTRTGIPSSELLILRVIVIAEFNENPDLDWAWDQVMPYLPEGAEP